VAFTPYQIQLGQSNQGQVACMRKKEIHTFLFEEREGRVYM
jgi:hypothetical protein